MGKDYRQYSKTSKTPRRPYEKERLDRELKLVGEYGLRNKKEIWRVQYTLSKVRSVARYLLTLNPKDPQRIFDGDALLRRLTRYGVLGENEQKLDYVLSLNAEKFLDRRLQTRVLHSNLANSIHHSRVLINQRHIRVGKRLVNIPSFLVRLDSEKNISFTLTSPLGGGPPGRVKKRSLKKAAASAAAGASEETDEAI